MNSKAVQNKTRNAIDSTANIVMLSSIAEVVDASISDNLLRMSLTTNRVIISNCLPIELVNDSGIVRINSYTSYAKNIEKGVYNESRNQTIHWTARLIR